MTLIPPGSIIGIIGGGQLGRMMALAAANLGYKSHIYCPEADCPASQVAYRTTIADYGDHAALAQFAQAVDVITFEFENIPYASVQLLAGMKKVHPGWKVLHTAQNRLREKRFATECGVETTHYQAVNSLNSLLEAITLLGTPAILKTTEQGYDGKGQYVIRSLDDAKQLEQIFSAKDQEGAFILEAFVDYTKEISVVLARSETGEIACFPPAENRHVGGILDTSIAPANIGALASQAISYAHAIAEKLELIGMLAIEFFVTRDNRLLFNEMAPRPHNSGHWTMDGCVTSQFEQCIRAVCGLPLGAVTAHSTIEMKNLIGDDIHHWQDILANPHAKLHIYGKSVPKEGRKMGHINTITPLSL